MPAPTTQPCIIFLVLAARAAGIRSPPDPHPPERVRAVRAYLRAVYPAAEPSLERASDAHVISLFESLDYYYAYDPQRGAEMVPRAEFTWITASDHAGRRVRRPPPPLPYLPAGAYYDASGGHGWADVLESRASASFDRWSQPVRVYRQAQEPPPRLHASLHARLGPAPSWTSPLAVVRYVLHPARVIEPVPPTPPVSSEAGPSAARLEMRLDAPALPLAPLGLAPGARGRAAEALSRLRALQHGSWLEVEAFGGARWANCPPHCGTWANVWRGTGVFMRVSAPFVSLSRATAIVEMLDEAGARASAAAATARAAEPAPGPGDAADAPASLHAPVSAPSVLDALARGLGVESDVQLVLERFPDASHARALAMVLFAPPHTRAPPCAVGAPRATAANASTAARARGRASGRALAHEAYEGCRWAAQAHALELHPDRFAEHVLLRRRTQGEGTAAVASLREFGCYWLHSVCGRGTQYAHRPRRKRGAGGAAARWVRAFDAVLATLACLLGVHTVILSASPNDNGLLHQELVDFEVPLALGGWEPIVPCRGGAPRGEAAACADARLHPLERCAVPFAGADGAGRADGHALYSYWQRSAKFRQLDPLAPRPPAWRGEAQGPSAPRAGLPCSLFGGEWLPPGGARACKSLVDLRPSGMSACYAWCEGSMSQAHANISISAIYDPAGGHNAAPPMGRLRRA